MNEFLANNLDRERFSDYTKQVSKYIVEDFNYYLRRNLNQERCSCQICTILEKPVNYLFDYKILRLKYNSIITSYSNDSLYGRIILILLNK